MQIRVLTFSCGKGHEYYLALPESETPDQLYGPLSLSERSELAMHSPTIIDRLKQKPITTLPTCPLKSTKQGAYNDDQEDQSSDQVDSRPSDSPVRLEGRGTNIRRTNSESRTSHWQTSRADDDVPAHALLPGTVGTSKRKTPKPVVEAHWWSDENTRELQEELVARSLQLLNSNLHHQKIKQDKGITVRVHTGYKKRLELSGITDPELVARLNQAQTNIIMWLTYGAASKRLEFTANNYKSLLQKHIGMLSQVEHPERLAVVQDAAIGLLWTWKEGSVFAYLNKFLNFRLFSYLKALDRASGGHKDITFIFTSYITKNLYSGQGGASMYEFDTAWVTDPSKLNDPMERLMEEETREENRLLDLEIELDKRKNNGPLRHTTQIINGRDPRKDPRRGTGRC